MAIDNAPGLSIADFPGLINNVDGRDLPAGAGQVQLNLASRQLGNLQSRRGLAPLSFETESTVAVSPDY